MKVQTFTVKGVKTEDTTLPKEFDQKVNLALLSQAVHVFEERGHIGLRKTKTRAEINRTTKKVYKQKGTGGARHGSRRANLFVGGGVALGPRPIRRILTLSDKMKSRAKLFAYSLKAKEGQLIVVTGLSKVVKTKEVASLMSALTKILTAKRFTFVLSESAKPAYKAFRNIELANTFPWKDASVYDIFDGGMIVMDAEIFKAKSEEVKAKSEKVIKTK
jgi:large subunit ribosomal protein L4